MPKREKPKNDSEQTKLQLNDRKLRTGIKNALPINWQGIFVAHPNYSKNFDNQFLHFQAAVSLSIVTKSFEESSFIFPFIAE